ncbi:14690_t:CDS:2 [Ambispora leptoticha]|uniref:14690_t:CDS:1 n=1 Tax=Ambispora leptoticha TaxID=144679 RepID=A0A9N8YTL2_9GLOM|nr:14690_t:CDS:2 [Ambispora leptoticha]
MRDHVSSNSESQTTTFPDESTDDEFCECSNTFKLGRICDPCTRYREKKRASIIKHFDNWSCGNEHLDEYLKKHQLSAVDNPHTDFNIKWVDFSEFDDVTLLDSGGEGTIYKAIWKKGPIGIGDKLIVLKALHTTKDFDNKFINEAICWGITKHPGTSSYMMILEYAARGNLHAFLKKNHPLSWELKIKIIYDIANTLRFFHQAGFAHRDLHISNILHTETGNFYVSDLGLGSAWDQNSTKVNEFELSFSILSIGEVDDKATSELCFTITNENMLEIPEDFKISE